MKMYEFSWNGFAMAKHIDTKKLLNNKELRNSLITCIAFLSYYDNVFAKTNSGEAALWRCVSIIQDGLFYLGILTSLLGLYIVLLKKDDSGKKLIATSFFVYVGSYLIPKAYIMLRSLLTAM
jgi:hypothetical protein